MITRSITAAGQLNLGRKLRGTGMEGDVLIQFVPDYKGVIISPYDPRREYHSSMYIITRFDQYNRVRIPTDMRKAAQIEKRVQISFAGDGLLVKPVKECCAICGSDQGIRLFKTGKYICSVCRDKLRDSHDAL